MKTNAPDLSLAGPALLSFQAAHLANIVVGLAVGFCLMGMPGRSNAADVDPRIVGGQPATIANHPYQVALIHRPYNSGNIYPSQFCGGSIVDQEWIVTAAHCSVGVMPGQVAVAVGVTDLTRPQAGRIFLVDGIIIHPNYNPTTQDNDVALWHLSTPIEFGSAYVARPIGLVSPSDAAAGATAAGQVALISGWGNTAGTGASANYPNQLQAAQLPLTALSDYPAGSVTASMIMAGYAGGGVDTCQGDSGGPLVVTTANGTKLLAGITSFGWGCAERGHPGVYARISHLHGWLTSWLPKRVVQVDWRFSGANPDGSLARPFPNVGQGYANVAAGGTVRIRQGNYLVRFPVTKPLLLQAYDGSVKLSGSAGNGFQPDGRFVTDVPRPTLGTTGLRPYGAFALHFDVVAGERYQVLTTTNLVNWEVWKDFVAGTEAIEFVDPDSAVTPHRFFKIVVP